MLLNTKDSVTDIALAAGFNSRSAFYRAFRAETGLTPSDFKQSPRSSLVLSDSGSA
jgi:AraC-like DNA-binding protein